MFHRQAPFSPGAVCLVVLRGYRRRMQATAKVHLTVVQQLFIQARDILHKVLILELHVDFLTPRVSKRCGSER